MRIVAAMRLKMALALAAAAALPALAFAAPATAAVQHPVSPAAAPAALPSIRQLVREGKLIPQNNCTSGYDSPYWEGLLPFVKYYMQWETTVYPPQVYSNNGGPHTNYCFYVVSGHRYQVIQQADTHNCLYDDAGYVPPLMDEKPCDITKGGDQWYIGSYFAGSLVDNYDYLCAYGSVNGGIYMSGEANCAPGEGNDGHLVWQGLH